MADRSLARLLAKRTTAWGCLQTAHAGPSERWFQTVHVTRQQIERHLGTTLGSVQIAQRTTHFFVLGMSLGPVLAAQNPLEMARAAVKVLDEWEAWVESGMMANKASGVGTGVKNLFRAQRSGRKSTSSTTESSYDHHGFTPQPHAALSYTSNTPNLLHPDSSLIIIHLPFALDYFQTIITLCELIRGLYTRLGELVLAPRSSSIPASGEISGYTTAPSSSFLSSQSAGSLSHKGSGATSPPLESPLISSPPGVVLHLQRNDPPSSAAVGGRLVTSPYPAPAPGTGRNSLRNHTIPTTSPWSAGLTELITKLDQRLKKPLITLTREMEHVARTTINEELATLIRGLTSASSNPPSSGTTMTIGG